MQKARVKKVMKTGRQPRIGCDGGSMAKYLVTTNLMPIPKDEAT